MHGGDGKICRCLLQLFDYRGDISEAKTSLELVDGEADRVVCVGDRLVHRAHRRMGFSLSRDLRCI